MGLPLEKRRRGHAVRGTVKWGQMMAAAREQALRYVRALPATEPQPPFVVVVDVGHCLDVYSNFAGVGESYVPFPDTEHYRLYLPDLADEQHRARLRLLFLDPQQLDPSRRAAQVTRQLAGHLAGLSSQLEAAGHASDVVAQFLMRCLFTMFAEDVELIPKASFGGLLATYAESDAARAYLPEALESLWAVMDQGGFSPGLHTRLRRFNGHLFHEAKALALNVDQVKLLQAAAQADWTEVEPAIFGTLLERALDPTERHSLGAHYTPRRYVERLVLPTVLELLRREWAAAQAASASRLDEGQGKKTVAAARDEILLFLRRLTSVRILDPACGSGNFLYVTLEHLKRLEGEVLATLARLGGSGRLELGDGTTVGPRQLLGLELNPRAAAIADVVLRIGYLQWHLRTYGLTQLREPLLDDYQNIRQQDAVLAYDGPDFANPRPAAWPAADFIVGNPPFIGDKRMRELLGAQYVEALRKTYKGQVPESADFVMYWWQKAAESVRRKSAERFGFITTNSISMTFNRRVIQQQLEAADNPLHLSFAIPDHPWVDSADGAAVRVAFTVGDLQESSGRLLTVTSEEASSEDDARSIETVEALGQINADLTIGADLDTAVVLLANKDMANNGMGLFSTGFLVDESQLPVLGYTTRPDLTTYIKPYFSGKDMVQSNRKLWVIDLFGMTSMQVLSEYPEVYQLVLEKIKPARDLNNRSSRRENWWLFGETNPKLRKMVKELDQYIVTPATAKHRVFQFVSGDVLPDDSLVAIASDDAYVLGILSSNIHITWALAAGADLGGNTPRYRKGRCFDPFPFPTATDSQQARIRELAEALDAHRKRQQAQHSALTLTDLYNVVEKLRAAQPLTAKEQATHERGLAAVVLSLHQQLDDAVADAYGWLADLPAPELLARLVQLNHARQQEEAAGIVRYLRPAYQAPGLVAAIQGGLALADGQPAQGKTPKAAAQPWPAELAQQMQAVRTVVQQAGQPLAAAQVAARFRSGTAKKVRPLLETLASLALLRFVEEEGAYAA